MLRSCKTCIVAAVAVALCVLHSGCDSVIYESEGDCTPHYKVRFAYDYNIKFADAFANEVDEVSLYLADANGNIVWQKEDKVVGKESYIMDVDVAPGTYDLYAWCQGESQTEGEKRGSSQDNTHPTQLSHLRRTIEHEVTADGQRSSSHDLHRLYHGHVGTVEFPDTYGTHEVTIPVVKNTNVVRIVLQQIGEQPLDANEFTFSIEDDNLVMDYDNSIVPGNTVKYSPWSVEIGSASMTKSTSVNAIVAEITTGRLIAEHHPVLTVNRKDGQQVLQIPLTDYALLVKGKYNQEMTDQEFLDRKDEFNLTFFLDEHLTWINSFIVIEDWRIVPQVMD